MLNSRVRYVVIGFLIALPIVGGIIGIKLLQFSAMGEAAAQQVMPPEPVNAIAVRESVWQPKVASVGTVIAVQGIVVRTEAEGVVREINFEAGSSVQAGDVLVQLDVDVEKTQLRVVEAAVELARASYKRAKDLIAERNISTADYDQAAISLKQTEAQVDNIRALINKKTLRAPFAGKLGIRRISVGQFLDKGSEVVSLQSLDPVYVDFSVPQQQISDLAQGLHVAVTSDAYPEQLFDGEITALNPDIDPATRNVRVQATLANADGRLRPGMFVEVALSLAQSNEVLIIPATAVLYAPYGDSVFIIEPDKDAESKDAASKQAGPDDEPGLVVRQQFVRLGERQGDFVAVTDGLAVGDQIVSTGTFKLRPGMQVIIDNSLAPEFKLAPAPSNS